MSAVFAARCGSAADGGASAIAAGAAASSWAVAVEMAIVERVADADAVPEVDAAAAGMRPHEQAGAAVPAPPQRRHDPSLVSRQKKYLSQDFLSCLRYLHCLKVPLILVPFRGSVHTASVHPFSVATSWSKGGSDQEVEVVRDVVAFAAVESAAAADFLQIGPENLVQS